MEAAKTMLTVSSMNTEEIAYQTGYIPRILLSGVSRVYGDVHARIPQSRGGGQGVRHLIFAIFQH
jgi:transcriptional regulator GlxA family with amidase domain